MIKYFCDACGVEIPSNKLFYIHTRCIDEGYDSRDDANEVDYILKAGYVETSGDYCVCKSCVDTLPEWIRPK